MAPEVLVGAQYDESADIYSLGLVAWEMLTGKCPYEGMTQVEVALAVVNTGARPVIPFQCSHTQKQFLERCWATDPKLRYSASSIVSDVNSVFN